MNATATRTREDTNIRPALHLAFELSNAKWTLFFTIGLAQKPRERSIPARNVERLRAEIERARRRFHLELSARVVSCYEAGRDGFWLHRFLLEEGVENVVVDSSSIEVKRRRRRLKTDRLDGRSLLRLLVRYHAGEKAVWSMVHVPTYEEEDARQLHRELSTLKRERTRVTNRIKGLLACQGILMPVTRSFPTAIEHVRLWDGRLLPPQLGSRLKREYETLACYSDRIRLLEAERHRLFREAGDRASEQVRQLCLLRGIGPNSAWPLATEFYSWRDFRNGRQVGALSGLVPSAYASGETERDVGITKAGNRHIRAIAVELAWCWLRYQPESGLTLWYVQRYGRASRRLRKIGIVALARQLLVALWRYLETGELPEGAELKTT